MTEWRPVAFVYVFLRADGIRKLGWTVNVRRRRSNCSTATGVKHEIEAVWQTDERTAMRAEGLVHYRLKKRRCRGHSSIELYDLPLETLVEEVDDVFVELGTKPGARKLGMTPTGFIKALHRERAKWAILIVENQTDD